MLASMFMINYFKIGYECLKWPDSQSFKKWWELFKLGLPTYLLQVFAFLSTETVMLLAGYVSTDILAANVALINIYYMVGLFGTSLQIVASALIGNKVGEGDLQGTKNMIKATVIICVSLIILSQFVFYFTTWKYKNQEMLKIYPIVSIALVVRSLSTLLITILIGLGLQKGTTYVSLLSFLVFGVPISCFLTFYIKWVYYGPWIGLMLTMALN